MSNRGGEIVSNDVDAQRQSPEPEALPPRIQRLAAALPARYVVQRKVGKGGAAHVLLAHDTDRNQLVAVKVLRPEVSTAIGQKRFVREIEIVKQLHHSNILPLLDYGAVGTQLFFTSPYIPGDTLRTKIQHGGQLPLGNILSILGDIAAALDHAHSQGIVHRDVTPANILFAEDRAVLADFGIARAVAAANPEIITASGIALGTPEYMSPEQCGAVRELDARCDVYALGCVVYEMLAGEPPFKGGSDSSIITRQCNAKPAPVSSHRPAITSTVDEVVATALAKTRAHRYYSAGEFFDAFDTAARERTHPAQASSQKRFM